MNLDLISGPDVEPLSLADAKLHLRVDIDDDNDLITSLIQAARECIQTATGRALITQQWELGLDEFPAANNGVIELPFGSLQSVDEITYIDVNGDTQTLDDSLYVVDARSEPARIQPAYNQGWPDTRGGDFNSVVVQFTCGYGDTGADVPAALRAAMKLLLGHWYENRQSVITGTITATIPQATEFLLWQYRIKELA